MLNWISKNHLHHHVVPLARISLTLSRHFSLSFIASSRFSWLHTVSSRSCCMYVRAGRPAFAGPYVGVNMSTSLMSSSLLLQQCRGIMCLHPVNVLSLWCFYRESLLLLRFILVGRMLVRFVPSSLCEWNRRPW